MRWRQRPRPPWCLAVAVLAAAMALAGGARAVAAAAPAAVAAQRLPGAATSPVPSIADALIIKDGSGRMRRLADVTRFRKVSCGRPNYPDYQEGCAFCWEYTPVDEEGNPEDPVITCGACKRGWALLSDDGTCDCARGYERQPCGQDAECCRKCAKGTAWIGDGLACEEKPEGTRQYAFAATVQLDRACNDPAAASTLANIKAAMTDLNSDSFDSGTLYVGLVKCVNNLKDASLGTVGGYYARYTYRVEYWGTSGSGESETAAAVKANPNLFCGERGEFYDSRCLADVGGGGGRAVAKPQMGRSWSISLPIQIDDAPAGSEAGACPEGSRLNALDRAARAALGPALRSLQGVRRVKRITFVQCNRIAPLTSGQIELWYEVEETHDFDAATGVGPFETLFESGVYGESAGGLLDLLPTLGSLQPPVDPELAYVGPPITCAPGGPRRPPQDDPSDVTPSPLYYLAGDGNLVTMPDYFDPRVIAPFAKLAQSGGATLDLLDAEDTGSTDVIVLAANGVREKFTGDKVVAAGTMFYGQIKPRQKVTCPGFGLATDDAAGASSQTMMGTLGQITAMSIEASDDSEESDLDFDHFAVILKVTNVPYGQPVKQKDVIDLVWQNGDHQQDGVDTDDLVTDAIWYQIRRDISEDGSETPLHGPVKTDGTDPEAAGTFLTLSQYAQQQTYLCSVNNGKGGLLGYRSTKLTPDTRVLAAAVAILPTRPFSFPDTDANEDGVPDYQLASSRSYSVGTLSITFDTSFPSRGGAAPGSGPTTYSVQFGAPEAPS